MAKGEIDKMKKYYENYDIVDIYEWYSVCIADDYRPPKRKA